MKILVKDGVWQVPADKRPSGWEAISAKEPDSVLLDSIVSESEKIEAVAMPASAPEPEADHCTVAQKGEYRRSEIHRVNFNEMADAIDADAVDFGADRKTIICAKIMVAGIWTRSFWKIMKWIMEPRESKTIAVAMKRFEECGIWSVDEGHLCVRLGEMDGTPEASIEFWMNASVGAEIFDGEIKNGQMAYLMPEMRASMGSTRR